MTLDEAYWQARHEWSDIRENLSLLEHHIRDTDAHTVIELGVRTGVSTVVILRTLAEMGDRQHFGRELWSVDVNWPRGPFVNTLGYEELEGRWHFIHGDDLDPEIVKRMPSNADIVFIDSWHSYDHTWAELHTYCELLRPGGRILLHDTELEHPEHLPQENVAFPVRTAAELFVKSEGEGYEFVNDTHGYGLGVIST